MDVEAAGALVLMLSKIGIPICLILLFLQWRDWRRELAGRPRRAERTARTVITVTIEDADGRSIRTQAESTRHVEDIREEVDELRFLAGRWLRGDAETTERRSLRASASPREELHT